MSTNASKLQRVRSLLRHIRENSTDDLCIAAADEALRLLAPMSPEDAKSDHAWLIDLFCRLWNERRGSRYMVQGAKDGAAVKRLLATGVDRAEIERRLRIAMDDPFFGRAGSLALFVSNWNGYDGHGRGAGTAAAARRRCL